MKISSSIQQSMGKKKIISEQEHTINGLVEYEIIVDKIKQEKEWKTPINNRIKNKGNKK